MNTAASVTQGPEALHSCSLDFDTIYYFGDS